MEAEVYKFSYERLFNSENIRMSSCIKEKKDYL